MKKGSRIAETQVKGFNKDKLLSKLIHDEVISKSGEFMQDYTFKSPSTASSIVGGASYNGWVVWRNKDNINMDELYQRL